MKNFKQNAKKTEIFINNTACSEEMEIIYFMRYFNKTFITFYNNLYIH